MPKRGERIAEGKKRRRIEETARRRDEGRGNLEALAKFSTRSWKTNYREKRTDKIGRDAIEPANVMQKSRRRSNGSI